MEMVGGDSLVVVGRIVGGDGGGHRRIGEVIEGQGQADDSREGGLADPVGNSTWYRRDFAPLDAAVGMEAVVGSQTRQGRRTEGSDSCRRRGGPGLVAEAGQTCDRGHGRVLDPGVGTKNTGGDAGDPETAWMHAVVVEFVVAAVAAEVETEAAPWIEGADRGADDIGTSPSDADDGGGGGGMMKTEEGVAATVAARPSTLWMNVPATVVVARPSPVEAMPFADSTCS